MRQAGCVCPGMNARKPPRLTIDERIARIRNRLGISRDGSKTGVPVRIFVPRSVDIGKGSKSN